MVLVFIIIEKGDEKLEEKPMDKYVIGIKELQKLLGISSSTAYKLVKNKEIPSIRIGAMYKITINDLNEWIAKKKINNAE